MTYLSRVELNPYRRETIAAMDSPQIMHAAVMASFISTEPQRGSRVLWRVDMVGTSVFLLIQSGSKPDLHHIVDQFGRPDAGQKGDTLDYEPFLNGIKEGGRYRFRIRANPVRSIPADGCRGKVKAHVTVAQQSEWLLSRAEKCGFAVESGENGHSIDVTNRTVMRFNRGNSKVTVAAATFEGVLEVVDRDLFLDTMRCGIGRAKAYGCGMISILEV